jgi:hypothetical protein
MVTVFGYGNSSVRAESNRRQFATVNRLPVAVPVSAILHGCHGVTDCSSTPPKEIRLMTALTTETIAETVIALLTEAYAGPPNPSETWFIDNERDSGILGLLARSPRLWRRSRLMAAGSLARASPHTPNTSAGAWPTSTMPCAASLMTLTGAQVGRCARPTRPTGNGCAKHCGRSLGV